MSRINSIMEFFKHDLLITMEEIVFSIAEESSYEKRMFLFEEYMDYGQLWKLYDNHDSEKIEKFSWKLCLEKGWLSLENLGHFKDAILAEGVTEEKWNEYANNSIQYMGEIKVRKYLDQYDAYRIKHKYNEKYSKKEKV